jgi:RHS repeat-associated protein
VHTLTQHPNQLPKTSRDAYSSTIEAVDDTYNYDANGNPVSITDGTPGSSASRTMGYDSLDRLTSANGIWGAANMSYDGLDNLLTYDVGTRRQKYLIGSDQLLQQVTKPNNGPVLLSFGYDNRGNTTTRTVGAGVSTLSFTYDLRNQVLTATKDGVTVQRNQYDGYGRRTVNTRANNDFRYDLHDPDGTRVWSGEFYPAQAGQRESQTNYVYLGGSLIAKYVFKRVPGTSAQRAAGDGYQIVSPFADAMCRDPMSGCDVLVGVGDGADGGDDAAAAATYVDTSEILFQHTDALGSPVAESNAIRQITRTNYEPFGNPLNTPTTDNEPSYTGHQFDTTTGLIYAQARYYDPVIGRFLSIDPMAVRTGNAGNFNRYNYANNSPYKFTDPDGRESACFATGIGCGLTPITQDIQDRQAFTIGAMSMAAIGATVMAPIIAPIVADLPVLGPVGAALANPVEVTTATIIAAEGGLVASTGGAAPSPASTFAPGPFAAESISARSTAQTFTAAERSAVNKIGAATGCHSCGSTTAGTKSGNFVPDHQPVSSVTPAGTAQRLYPHCLACSRRQGLEAARMIRNEKKENQE